jgi:energy-coupling factor transporter ATP-binding protein EcfA2
MFSRKERPLPTPVLQPPVRDELSIQPSEHQGILLGSGVSWNPESLPNGHVVVIGASGSGKTQTLKALAYELHRYYSGLQIVIIDFHGDQALADETCYPLHMSSPYGINPLVVNLDPEGGGPNLQAIAVTSTLKKNLLLGVNQEGLMLEILQTCYFGRGILQEDQASWDREPPNFKDIQQQLEARATDDDQPCKESQKLKLKLAATFTYGIFNRPSVPFLGRLSRIDLCKLPPELGAIAAESLAKQLMDAHRLQGEIGGKVPRTYLFIDEAKEMAKSSALNRIIADGRKYGLNLVLASQSERHLSADVLGNAATKIVLPVDQMEVKKVATKFRFAEQKVAQLLPLNALCRFGTQALQVAILPYYQRTGG